MTLKEITSYLEAIAPLRFQEGYDNSGLLYGSPEKQITGAVISLDCTEEVVQEAKDLGYNLIISHHPIIFHGLKRFSSNYYVDKTIVKAIKEDIAIYAIHTNLDNVLSNGVNEKIALKLHVKELQLLGSKNESGRQARTVTRTVNPDSQTVPWEEPDRS